MTASSTDTGLWACMYVSSASSGLTFSALEEIVTQSRDRNAQAGITGALLFGGGNFMQYFEGPKTQVDDLLARAQRDPRHHDVRVMLHDPIEKRTFADWRMGFLSGESLRERAAHPGLADDPALRARLSSAQSALENVMQSFHQNMR